MAGLWQRTGNVTVTNGSKTVTGFGTKWKTGILPVQKGHAFYGPDNAAYEVDTVVSDESILLVDAYRGGTLANQPYRIDITRTSTISQFAADLAALVGKYRAWFDGMMSWLTGSGDVSILNPDTGATTTLPSWKKVASEGEGQAARAKAEADKALAAADLAVNVVRDSAMPLPDVWIPLTDSLRMFTGLGREVKVGGDLVGRYVNFERASAAWYFDKSGVLQQAAINEARFESEGLLVEGASTNLFRWDATRLAADGGVLSSVTSPKYPGITAKKVTGGSNAVVFGASREQIKNSTTYTATAIIDLANSRVPGKRLRIQFAYGANWPNGRQVNFDTDGNILSITADTAGTIRKIGDLLIVTATTTSSGEASTSGGGSVDMFFLNAQGGAQAPEIDWSLCVVGFQLEESAFPSSFILTSNAAVTRAADICEIPTAGNIPPGKFTAAAQVNVPWLGKTAPNTAPRILSITGGEAGASVETTIYSDGRFNAFGGVSGASSIVSGFTNRGVVSMVRSDTGVNAYAAGNKNVGSQGIKYGIGPSLAIGSQKGSIGRHFFGHIRNIKIWHQEASDPQIKALR